MTTYIPFTNGTQAMYWQEQNCARCRRTRCAARTALDACRNLTANCMNIVGAGAHGQDNLAFADMPVRCASYTIVPVPRKKPVIGRNVPGLPL
jgi:hypothetical protein